MWRGVVLPQRRLPELRLGIEPFSLRGVRVVTLAILMGFVIATALGISGRAGRGSVALGATTTLTIIGGEVAVSADGVAFHAATDGDALRAGTTVRTSANTYAVITYFDGSTVSLDPDTSLTVATLDIDPDGSTRITMFQSLGRSWHVVQRLLRGGSRYEVTTPTMTASVRGTMFAVGVTSDAQGRPVTTLDTSEGAVAVVRPGAGGAPASEVLVGPGQRATVTAGAPTGPLGATPSAESTVVVTIGASSGVVVDTVGRADGVLDDRIVVQTPGASVERRSDHVVIRLPDIPDGKVVAVVKDARARGVEVRTIVQQNGRTTSGTSEIATAGSAAVAVASVEIAKGRGVSSSTPSSDEEKSALAARVKTADTGGRDKKKDDGGPGSGGPGGLAPDTLLPPLPFGAHSGGQSASGFVSSEKLPSLPGERESQRGNAPERHKNDRDGGAPGVVPALNNDQGEPAAAPAQQRPPEKASGGFVPGAPLPEIPSGNDQRSKPDSGSQSGTVDTRDTKGSGDKGTGKSDPKGKP